MGAGRSTTTPLQVSKRRKKTWPSLIPTEPRPPRIERRYRTTPLATITHGSIGKMILQHDFHANRLGEALSDADDQTVGSGDPHYDHPPSSKTKLDEEPKKDSENDNDVMTEDDLPAGG